jgi:uncharacterized protein YidB (DUF937 family)
MSRGMPSMTALLGLLALAGYQNRDKLAELLKGAGSGNPQPGSSTQQGPLDGLLGSLGGGLAGGGVGGLLSGGLGELLERFKQNGQGDAAESWINKGPNKELPPPQLKQAIGPDVLAASKLGCRRRSFWRGCRESFLRLWINVHLTAVCPARTIYRKGSEHEHSMDNHYWLHSRRHRKVHHAGRQRAGWLHSHRHFGHRRSVRCDLFGPSARLVSTRRGGGAYWRRCWRHYSFACLWHGRGTSTRRLTRPAITSLDTAFSHFQPATLRRTAPLVKSVKRQILALL